MNLCGLVAVCVHDIEWSHYIYAHMLTELMGWSAYTTVCVRRGGGEAAALAAREYVKW